MNILLISGSLSTMSYSGALLRYFAQQISKAGQSCDIVNFTELPLPLFVPDAPNSQELENTQTLVKKINQANGLIIATPLYHGSLSGVLKNALDHLPSTAFGNKPIALANVGGGIRAGQSACEHLRTIIRSMSGHVIQTQLGCFDGDFKTFDEELHLNDAAIKQRADKLVLELINMSENLSSNR